MGTAHEQGMAQDMAVVRRIVEAIWNRGELAVADTLFAPGYVNHGGLIPNLVQGPEAIKVAVALYRAAFPTFHVTVEELRADGSTVLLRWVAHDDIARAPADDTEVDDRSSLSGTTSGRFVDGQVAESWTSWGAARAVRRWGLVPSSEPGAPV
jgi:hypothetical protein